MAPRLVNEVTPARTPRWSLATRVAFRLCFVYFSLFCVTTQVLTGLFPIPKLDLPDVATLQPIRGAVLWTAAHIFHITRTLVYEGSGSGDKTFDWVLASCTLMVTCGATAVWSWLDRRRENYATLYKWFRLAMRFALGSELVLYGMDKAVPLQMPFPFLTKLVEPYGNFSPMGVLWSSVGSSRPYEIFVGCAELFGGVLLFLPRTTMFGALISLADMTQVWMLNMTYDVPVKLFSFHLILLSLFLLAPDLKRLLRFFFGDVAPGPRAEWPLFGSARANRVAAAAQALFGVALLAGNGISARLAWDEYGPGRPRSPLYGIWNVQSPALPASQWRRVIFDFPTSMAVQQMNDSLVFYSATVNVKDGVIGLKGNGGSKAGGKLTFQRPAPGRLSLDGDLDGQKVAMQLELMDTSKMPLVSRGFHWIQEYPFNK